MEEKTSSSTSIDIDLTKSFSRFEESDITPETAINLYKKNGFLWIRLNQKDRDDCHSIWNNDNDKKESLDPLRKIYKQRPDCIKRRWAVENRGDAASDDMLSPSTVLLGDSENESSNLKNGPFYVSAIVQKDHVALNQLYQSIRFLDDNGEPPLLNKSSRTDDGCWLFLGRNPTPSSSSNNDNSTETKKRQSKQQQRPLAGRAEHVDEVSHSGTWHVQILGTKTWLIRPNANATNDWDDDDGPPSIQNLPGAERSEKNKAWRLRITVEAGDLFVLNTRAWYHRTEIEKGLDGYSLSVARDFFLDEKEEEDNDDGAIALNADRDVKEGEVIFDEDDLPDDFPRSDDPNCSLAEIADEDDVEDGSGDEDDETRIALVALRDVKKGEALTIAVDDENDEEEEENEKMNAADGIDPRAIANRSYSAGEIVLESDDIPEDLPCSADDANCELVEESDACIKLRALRDIVCGDILTLAPDEDEEYEETEVSLDTHEFVKS